jgi:hypothetical protein
MPKTIPSAAIDQIQVDFPLLFAYKAANMHTKIISTMANNKKRTGASAIKMSAEIKYTIPIKHTGIKIPRAMRKAIAVRGIGLFLFSMAIHSLDQRPYLPASLKTLNSPRLFNKLLPHLIRLPDAADVGIRLRARPTPALLGIQRREHARTVIRYAVEEDFLPGQ